MGGNTANSIILDDENQLPQVGIGRIKDFFLIMLETIVLNLFVHYTGIILYTAYKMIIK